MTNHPPPDNLTGAASVPGAFSASTKQASYDSGDEFDYEGKADGAMYGCGGKSNASSVYLSLSCRAVALDPLFKCGCFSSFSFHGGSLSVHGESCKQFLLIPWGISLSPWGVLPHPVALCGVRREWGVAQYPTHHVIHKGLTPSTFPRQSSHCFKTMPGTHSSISNKPRIAPTCHSWWLTPERPTICYQTRPHSFPTTSYQDVAFGYGEQLLRPYRRPQIGDNISQRQKNIDSRLSPRPRPSKPPLQPASPSTPTGMWLYWDEWPRYACLLSFLHHRGGHYHQLPLALRTHWMGCLPC